jgi:hypothetical protein
MDAPEIMLRIHATVAAREPGRNEVADRKLLRLVDRDPIAGVVVAARSAQLAKLERALFERGFNADWEGNGYRVWIRHPQPGLPPPRPSRADHRE